MVSATFTPLLKYDTIDTYFNDDLLDLQVHKTNRAAFVDSDSHNRIVIHGTGLTYDGDELVGGTITDISFKGSEGGEFAAVTGADFDAGKIANVLTGKGVEAMVARIFAGDDKIIGSGQRDILVGYAGDDKLLGRTGSDALEGGKGDDILTGGKGSDLFLFDHGDGHDKVTDFDAIGGGKDQDYIGVDSLDDFTIRKSGSDTVVDFGNGETLTLVDVARSHVSSSDFHVM